MLKFKETDVMENTYIYHITLHIINLLQILQN